MTCQLSESDMFCVVSVRGGDRAVKRHVRSWRVAGRFSQFLRKPSVCFALLISWQVSKRRGLAGPSGAAMAEDGLRSIFAQPSSHDRQFRA